MNIDRAVFITIHHQSTVPTAIGPLVQRHRLLIATAMTLLGRIAFTNTIQCFPVQQTLVGKHLHKARETPIIVNQTVSDLPLASFLRSFLLVCFENHLLLGKIANDHSAFSQSVGDKMRCFVQTVALFAAFAFGYALVDLGEIHVSPRFLFTAIALGSKLIQLLVVPTIPFEPTNVIKLS